MRSGAHGEGASLQTALPSWKAQGSLEGCGASVSLQGQGRPEGGQHNLFLHECFQPRVPEPAAHLLTLTHCTRIRCVGPLPAPPTLPTSAQVQLFAQCPSGKEPGAWLQAAIRQVGMLWCAAPRGYPRPGHSCQ